MSDIQDQKRQLKRREQEAQQAEEDLKSLMKQPAFRRYIQRIIAGCGVSTTGFCAKSEEAHYRMGMRDVGLKIDGEIKAKCFDAWLQMQQEASA